MADCSYTRCLQERRFIKRELQKWTKNMFYIVGLERVAEELMGRRKWKQFQDLITRSNINIEAPTNLAQQKATSPVVNNGHHHIQEESQDQNLSHSLKLAENEIEKDDSGLNSSNQNTEKEPESDQSSEVAKIKEEPPNATESESEKKTDTETEEPQQGPIDWKPQDKCYFCVDGKLLKVNEAGELVAESGPVPSEADLTNRTLNDSESESSESEHDIRSKLASEQSKHLAAFLRQQPNMTSYETLATQLAAVASLGGLQPSGLAPFYPGLWYGLPQPPSAVQKPPSESPQPSSLLDHLHPPNTSNSPRLKAELLGTGGSGEQPLDLSAKSTSGPSGSHQDPKTIFRAKPRLTSSVPNKRAYTEEELQNALRDILSGKLGTRRAAVIYGIPRSTLRNKVYKYTMENRQQIPRPDVVIPAMLEDDDDEDGGDTGGDNDSEPAQTPTPTPMSSDELLRLSTLQAAALQNFMKPPAPAEEPKPVMPPLIETNLLIQLQTLLLGGGLGALQGLLASKPDEVSGLPDVLRKIMLTQAELLKHTTDNGQPSYLNLMQMGGSGSRSGSKSEEEHSESGTDDLGPIRIPSFKPVPGGSSGGKNNGDVALTTPPPPCLRPNNFSPPPLTRPRPDSSSPPPMSHKSMLSLSDVIAKSISRNFQQEVARSNHHQGQGQSQGGPPHHDLLENYKRPGISVIKSLGSMERFGQSSGANLSPGSGGTGTGGKGTRPKRGKYRNYDRDSLVEAVKAVQRGEMSVHRAGSYYGVPHSTLEYKVKERHLMRPRKREPKPQAMDGSSPSSSASKSPASTAASLLDKAKMMGTKPPLKTPSPNGLKVPPGMFDSASMLSYPSPFMWPPHAAGFPMQGPSEFRGAAPSQQPPSFAPPAPDTLFTQHMMQRLQEERGKNGAESLNGSSFLDGIIRHSLDKKPAEMNHGALFDQLVKNNRLAEPADPAAFAAAAVSAVPGGVAKKRPASPLTFAQQQPDIKKERASPPVRETSPDREDFAKEAVENLIKIREGLGLKMETGKDDSLNGTATMEGSENS